MMMPAISHFDGASLFAGNNFMSAQSTQALDPPISPAKSHAPQRLLPLTVKQIAESCFSSDDKSNFTVDGVEANFRVLGMVVDKVDRVTDVTFLLDDGTGRIEISRWISVPSDSAEVSAIENGMYVQINGHMKEFQGKRHAFAFSVRPVIDFNDISLHFIECMHVHLVNIRLKGGVPAIIQTNPAWNVPFSNGVNGNHAPFPNKFLPHSSMDGSANDICKLVLRLFQDPPAR